ncbi:uncharacterized protein LOC756740 [Strongylocentrotus purpuratus]|uniref:Centromere protein Q n=1 Tax=Strongylocentrotus purpuratus TaxID=7668 RepID=A0A7M7LIN0_STRPU|nr:uncharacterized protein LOC756740 [Strongylocentrotus purpuratus]XP_011673393.1 uncharacterized protein LOC756740 [Strongylocentrotus purpuratus]XP_011673394.1 uncharacterized protein LOC756740 [Strongylocentrotus purpuratus]XP_011673395.1 uncharacterized protein LOC756740 [Strongylocentrotus purpuratus]XP_030848336.1 uncharacterized protein LOC756740 [Strongylocentrotus purpuratus]XP_030848337.1 uncharacterized protein LOC756740 [Strongylocentrotus purpuratus]XP_030848338.1 uncharacterize|eukprot:XP_001196442.1 PREDICTED: uncharacterized protein LOC756740 [Strongylocentrotus purpuratus]
MPKVIKKTSSTGKKSQQKASTSRSRIRSDSPIVRTAVNVSQISKSKRKKAQNGDGEMFKERTVSARTFSHWKPITKSSQALLVQTIDSAIISVLSETSSVAYSDVRDVLNSLKKRILDKSRNLKAPATKRPKFNTLEAACQKLESEVVEALNQEEQLSEMVEQMTRTVQEKEEILEELEKAASKTKKKSQL